MAQRMTLYGNGESWQKAFLDTICSRQKGFRYERSKFIDAEAKGWCSILLLNDTGARFCVLDNHWPLGSLGT
jgi:hypothetical protein